MHGSYPLVAYTVGLLLCLQQASLCFAAASSTPRCLRNTFYAIGSYNSIRWRPEFSGKGVTILRQKGRKLHIHRILPVSLIGDNPTYVTRQHTPKNSASIFYMCNSVSPDSNLTRVTMLGKTATKVKSVTMPGMTSAHVSVARNGKYVLSANVFGGTVYAYSADLRKRTGEYVIDESLATDTVPKRQKKPNPHQVLPYLYNRVAVPDLGADCTFILAISPFGGLSHVSTVRHTNGDGPRHAVFHTPSRNLFVVNELSQTVSTLCVSNKQAADKFVVCQRWSLLAAGPHVNGTAAAIRLSSDNKFLYVSARRDSKFTPVYGRIVAFRLNVKTGRIVQKIGEWSSGGVHPRDFHITENVRVKGECRSYLVLANRDSNNVVFIRRYRESGKLGPIEIRRNIGTPSSVLPL